MFGTDGLGVGFEGGDIENEGHLGDGGEAFLSALRR
jgi:hypothetical protein